MSSHVPATISLALLACAACTTTPGTSTTTRAHPSRYASEERVVFAGDDIVFVGASNTGAMYVGRDQLNVEFLDTDGDRAADFVRYSGPRTAEGCANSFEDYDADGLFDARVNLCDDAALGFIEVRVGEAWFRVQGQADDRHILMGDKRYPVLLENGRFRVVTDAAVG